MYLFFMISGFLFVTMASIFFSYIYELFEVNEITTFIKPTDDSIYSNITITIIPLIIWSLIEIIVLHSNKFFMLGFILNVFLNISILYVIRYGYNIFKTEKNDIIIIISIIIAVFFGFLSNYLCLKVSGGSIINPVINLSILTLFIIVFGYSRKKKVFKDIK